MNSEIFTYALSMDETVGLAVILLLLGRFIKECVPLLKKFFIPAPVVGGIVFSFITLVGHELHLFQFTFDTVLKNLLMLVFFTTIGFTASIKMLMRGGISVFVFLLICIVLIVVQNSVGIGLSILFDQNPLMGLATGSVSLIGGHGTSGAFGPELEKAGLTGATTVAIAAATFGLVAGGMIGGPVGKRLLQKFDLHQTQEDVHNQDIVEGKLTKEQLNIDENLLFKASCYIVIAMGLGYYIVIALSKVNFVVPAYLGPMIVAAVIRNFLDFSGREVPLHSTNVIGNISLQFFLAMALMSINLWELSSLAIPLITILLVQTIVMATFAYFITFRVMGKDYDAAVIATGHCGFGMGATPNAMANMETFTGANGESAKAFFVVPIVGSLFIDFVNSIILGATIGYLQSI